MAPSTDPVSVSAEARVFGHDPTPVTLLLVPRSTGWRAGRAARWFVAGAVLAPLVAVLPPHAPWAVGAGAGGVVLGLRKWGERYTLVGVDGRCPRCDAPLEHGGRTPLKVPHAMACDGCGNPVALHPDLHEVEGA